MGPLEPVVCLQGNYCPDGGKVIKKCPTGHYCQPGAATPTPCSFGSTCPEGSQYDRFLIPIVLLALVDILLIVGIVWHTVAKRLLKRNGKGVQKQGPRQGLLRAMTMGAAGYRELPDERDNDMEMTIQPPYMSSRADIWSGFQTALEVAHVQGMRIEHLEGENSLSPQLRAFVESMRKATDAAHFGLSFHYSGLSFQPGRAPKPIIQNITGSIKRGSLVAVMGGSGAGKSTFVNVLMGKITKTKGAVMINNVPGRIKRYKKLIGYVPQDDIVLPELTVYENILHSARIRLPRTWSDEEIVGHVNAVIDCLELSHVHDSLVGSVGKPVISGGQRKRVSIGMELAAAPMAIFLDEPTSGLDATAASSIMKTLQALARLGISVIVIIHQPRMEIFDMLDDLILLANGQIIYEGPERGVQDFFEKIGFRFPEHSNFGDVVTDIITGNGRAYKKVGDISKEGLIAHWASSRENAAHKAEQNTEQSAKASRVSLVDNLLPSKIDRPMHQILKTRGATRLKQVWLCLRRSFLQQYRTKSIFWFEMALASLAGFLIGLAQNGKKGIMFIGFYKPPYQVLSIATDMISVPQLALLTAIGIGLVSAAPGVRVFSEETLLQRREAEAGHSRIAYFLAKVVAVVPRMILACLHFTTLMMILAVPIIPWGLAFIANLMYVYCIYGLANVISMVAKREDAPLFATMISLIVGILSGAAPTLSQVKSWNLEWLWRASPGTWLAELYFGQLITPFGYLYDIELASQLTGFRLNWLWRNILILFGIGTAYRVIAYFGLFFGKRMRL
jgi:ABC-type multidrug transport system ATPase subunit